VNTVSQSINDCVHMDLIKEQPQQQHNQVLPQPQLQLPPLLPNPPLNPKARALQLAHIPLPLLNRLHHLLLQWMWISTHTKATHRQSDPILSEIHTIVNADLITNQIQVTITILKTVIQWITTRMVITDLPTEEIVLLVSTSNHISNTILDTTHTIKHCILLGSNR